MEYFVTRLYAEGIRLGKEAREAGRTCGKLGFEWNTHRERRTLVATLFGNSRWLIPGLVDPTIAGMVGDSWILTGQEIIRAEFDFTSARSKGPDRIYGQMWVVEPEDAAALDSAMKECEKAKLELDKMEELVKQLRAPTSDKVKQAALERYLDPNSPDAIRRHDQGQAS